MSDRQAWDRALAQYEISRVLVTASETFGPHNQMNDAYDLRKAQLDAMFGGRERARATGSGEGEYDLIWDQLGRDDAANSEAIFAPMWTAAEAVMRTPAPDVEALKIKLEVILREDVWNHEDRESECWSLIKADADRLTAEIAR